MAIKAGKLLSRRLFRNSTHNMDYNNVIMWDIVLSSVCFSVSLFICLFVFFFVCLSVCLSLCLFVCLFVFVCLSAFMPIFQQFICLYSFLDSYNCLHCHEIWLCWFIYRESNKPIWQQKHRNLSCLLSPT